MPKNVQMPDGKIVEFPDNMSDAEVSNAIRTSNRPAVPGIAKPNLPKVMAPGEFGKGFIHTIPDMLMHPKETGAAMGQPFVASGMAPGGMYPTTGPGRSEDMKANAGAQAMAQEGQRQGAEEVKNNPAYALGGLASQIALGEGIKRIAPIASSAGSAIRTAAIGDTDAAALKGLRVPPGSPKSLRTVSAVEGARPFLQGAKSLEDLQSKIPGAKNEIWTPYKQTVEAIGDKKVAGPDGPTTVQALEDERQQLSALNRGLKQQNPEAIQLAQQKGMTQAQLLDREKAFQKALDPHLEAAGVDPRLIRQTFGQVSQVGERVSGKSTLAEKPQPYGLGRIANLSLEKPLAAPKEILGGMRDIAAGRPWFQGSPTDVNLREAFRTAGPKPDFRAPVSSMPRAEAPPLRLEANVPGNADYGSDSTQGGFPQRPPIAGQSPPSRLALPSAASPGETQPMAGILKHPGEQRSFTPPTDRITAPPEFLKPAPTESQPRIASPEGIRTAPKGLLQGGFTTPPTPESTTAHIYPAGSAFRNQPIETPVYPAGSAFRPPAKPFDIDAYLKGQQ